MDGFSFTFEFNATLEELVAFYKWEREKSEKSLNFLGQKQTAVSTNIKSRQLN